MTPLIIVFLLVIVLISSVYGGLYRRHKARLKAYQASLETSQIKLDRQTSQFNIFTRALPNLQVVIHNARSSDDWKTLAVDEIRALCRAEMAGYWRYVEDEHVLLLDVRRGVDGNGAQQNNPVRLEDGGIGEAARLRAPILDVEKGVMALPFVVSDQLWGVFRLDKRLEDRLTQRDVDMVAVFLKQIAVALENRDMIQNREKFYLELVQALADTLDARDASTAGQTRRMRQLACATARELAMPDEFIYYLEFAALMHDIGKIAIDEKLLKKPGKLTPQEFEIVKKHPEFGHRILAPVSLLAPAAPMVLYHQEWFNGEGYPEGLRGEEIPLGARIVALLDAWAAMTSDHPWRAALAIPEAIKEIKKGSGTQFDPNVVEAFLAALDKQGMTIL